MKIMVVSDNHGYWGNFEKAVDYEKPDMLFHLGDSELYADELERIVKCPFKVVKGNCDGNRMYPYELVVNVGEHKIFLAHGHRHGVRSGIMDLIDAAREKDCDMAFYGHNHVPLVSYDYGMFVASPGSIEEPRQYGRQHTYMILNVDESGKISHEMKAVEEL